ncbi:MAG TPA: hypothetical protein VNZ57_06040 [Longimicrobiales bacterium]|nr:hypothetical protein [Longimicrobiales bacterium]
MATTPVGRGWPGRLIGALAACACSLLVPGSLLAQACIGSPAARGHVAVGGNYFVSEQMSGYGVHGVANVLGPVSLGGEYGIIEYNGIEEKTTRIGASGAVEFTVASDVSVCPTVQAEYTTRHEPAAVSRDRTTLTIPFGVSVGILGHASAAELIPHVGGGMFFRRTAVEFANGRSDSASETGLFYNGGATVAIWRVYAGMRISHSTLRGATVVVRFSAGFRL